MVFLADEKTEKAVLAMYRTIYLCAPRNSAKNHLQYALFIYVFLFVPKYSLSRFVIQITSYGEAAIFL